MPPSPTDRIERTIDIRAPRPRVWRALTDAAEFGAWFGVKLRGAFAPGARLTGNVTHPGYEHVLLDITIERVEPDRLLSWRWHPHAVEKGVDYSKEPTTLVMFELDDTADGVVLTVSESGFDRIPLERRAKAFAANEGGWTMMVRVIEKYVTQGA